MRPLRFFYLLCLAAVAAFAQTPTITAVENVATNIPPGLPNSAIAQGSMFAIKGTNLGPANAALVTNFPLLTALGGTSIKVTVAGTTVDAIPVAAIAAQVNAILPSKTPVGTGTVQVSYNNQSVSAPIVVVKNNFGIFTVSQSGTGDAVAFLNSDSGLITPSHAANPGDAIVLWGTGLGPVAADESQPAVQADMTDVPLQVFVGGKPAKILFRGRNACCSSIDTVYVTAPDGVSGCAVSVIVQTGNVTSNATSIAIAPTGRTCTPINQNTLVGGTGTHTFGGVSLQRIVENINAAGTNTTVKMDSASATFLRVTYASTAPQGSQLDVNSYGSCSVSTATAGRSHTTPLTPGKVYYLDAGASLGLSAPFGNRTIPKSTPSAGVSLYLANLDQTATTLTAGQYTFTGTGGADVGSFTATYVLPPPFVWTNQSSISTVNRAAGLTVTWSGGDPAGYVTIAGSSTAYGTNAASTVTVSFTCTARVSDGAFTVPPVVLLAVPPSSALPGTTIVLPGVLTVTSVGSAQTFQPPSGIEAAGMTSSFIYASSATFQ